MFKDSRKSTMTEADKAAFLAKLAGTYTSGAMTARTEVATMEQETVTDEQRANVGKTRKFVNDAGYESETRSGVGLMNI